MFSICFSISGTGVKVFVVPTGEVNSIKNHRAPNAPLYPADTPPLEMPAPSNCTLIASRPSRLKPYLFSREMTLPMSVMLALSKAF